MALGTRTPKQVRAMKLLYYSLMTTVNKDFDQVASRIQKYFIKLAKHGLPVPGRMPNLNVGV
jgi:hypothetical protein